MDLNQAQLIGSNIKRIRKSRRFSLNYVARIVNIPIRLLSNIERGKVAASSEVLFEIATIFGMRWYDFSNSNNEPILDGSILVCADIDELRKHRKKIKTIIPQSKLPVEKSVYDKK